VKAVRPRLAVIAALLGMLGAATGCARPDAPLRIESRPAGADTRLTVDAAPHLKINARLAPSLKLANGTILRFTGGRLTADSAYFAEPPSATLPGRHPQVHGTLRASVCQDDEQVCRSVSVRI